jgi:hypothetical protein
MTDVGKARQYRRVKLLKQQPVTDDVLDIVRHHGEHGGDKEPTEVTMLQSREGDSFMRNRRSFSG